MTQSKDLWLMSQHSSYYLTDCHIFKCFILLVFFFCLVFFVCLFFWSMLFLSFYVDLKKKIPLSSSHSDQPKQIRPNPTIQPSCVCILDIFFKHKFLMLIYMLVFVLCFLHPLCSLFFPRITMCPQKKSAVLGATPSRRKPEI